LSIKRHTSEAVFIPFSMRLDNVFGQLEYLTYGSVFQKILKVKGTTEPEVCVVFQQK
jgi:hypothetical protein